MINHNVIVVAFNAKLTDGCDYATQTLKILGKTNHVYALLLGEPLTWKDILFSAEKKRIISKQFNSIIVRPFFLLPGQRINFIRQCNYVLNALALRLYIAIRYNKKKKILWFFEPWNMIPIFISFAYYSSLYDCVDYYRSLGVNWKKSELWLVRRVTRVVCNSHILANSLKIFRNDISVVPLGFAFDMFKYASKHLRRRNRFFTVGYIGGINYRLDYKKLFEIISNTPQVRYIFIGPIQLHLIPEERSTATKAHALFSMSNVEYLGEVKKVDIAKYIGLFDVGMVPYDTRYDFNKFSYPLKIMEYFWQGIPILSTKILSLQQFSKYIFIHSTSQEWIKTIKSLEKKRWPEVNKKQQRYIAMNNSWEKKIETISGLL